MTAVTKEQLIRKTASDTDSTIVKSRAIIDTFLVNIADYVIQGEPIQLQNYFSVVPMDKKERVGRNPKTGEQVIIPAKRTVKIKVSKKLRDAVNGAPK